MASVLIKKLELGKVYRLVYDMDKTTAYLHENPNFTNGKQISSGFEFVVIQNPLITDVSISVNVVGTQSENIGWFTFIHEYAKIASMFEEVMSVTESEGGV